MFIVSIKMKQWHSAQPKRTHNKIIHREGEEKNEFISENLETGSGLLFVLMVETGS